VEALAEHGDARVTRDGSHVGLNAFDGLVGSHDLGDV